MKKNTGLYISDEHYRKLLGINEKYNLLFIAKDKELILFSLKAMEVKDRYNLSGFPKKIVFTQSQDYMILICEADYSYQNKVYVINLKEDSKKIEFSLIGEAADSYLFTIHSLSNYPNHILIGRKYSLELFNCEKREASLILPTSKEIHLVKVIEGEEEDYIAIRFVPEYQPDPNMPTIDPPDIQYYKLGKGEICEWKEPDPRTSKYFKEKTIRFINDGNQSVLLNSSCSLKQVYNHKLYNMGIRFVDYEGRYLSGNVNCFDKNDNFLRRYSFLMDTKTLMPVYVQKDGPSLYYYAKRNYLIYEEDSKEDYIAIVEFTEEDHQSLTMELLSKGRVKRNKVDSKGFKQIVL